MTVKRHRVSLSWWIRPRGSLSNKKPSMQGFSLSSILKPGSHESIKIIKFLERKAPLVYCKVSNILLILIEIFDCLSCNGSRSQATASVIAQYLKCLNRLRLYVHLFGNGSIEYKSRLFLCGVNETD